MPTSSYIIVIINRCNESLIYEKALCFLFSKEFCAEFVY